MTAGTLRSLGTLGTRTSYPEISLLVAGRAIPAEERGTVAVVNPATEEVVGHQPAATAEDAVRAAQAAAEAFATWRAVPAFDRARLIRGAAQLLRDRVDHIAEVMTLENGKTRAESRGEVLVSADTLDWVADEARRSYGRVVPSRFPDGRCLVLQEPVGPVAAFTPWNAPALTVVRKVGSALAAGCPIVLKPAPETPGTAWEIVSAFADVFADLLPGVFAERGMPAGVLQLLTGDPNVVGPPLLASRAIRKVTFTGSVPVGRLLARQAAETLKRITLELGGHAPVIVCADADVERAVDQMAEFKLRHSGQVCAAPSRFYVHESRYDAFVDAFAAKVEQAVVGNGLDPATTMGPLTHERRLRAMESFVADARLRGAEIVTGGERVGDVGWFFAPTVLAEATEDMTAMRDEVFGPVAPMARFSDLEDAVTRANASDLGLTAFVYTESERTARHLSNAVEAGLVAVNTGGTSLPELPFGGIKHSGYGLEGGVEGLEAYTTRKLVNSY